MRVYAAEVRLAARRGRMPASTCRLDASRATVGRGLIGGASPDTAFTISNGIGDRHGLIAMPWHDTPAAAADQARARTRALSRNQRIETPVICTGDIRLWRNADGNGDSPGGL